MFKQAGGKDKRGPGRPRGRDKELVQVRLPTHLAVWLRNQKESQSAIAEKALIRYRYDTWD